MKKLIFLLTLLVAIGVSAQSIPDSTKTVWGWPNEVIQAAIDEGAFEYNLASEKVVDHKVESTLLAIAILAGYLFFCFITTASDKIERLTIFNRVPIVLINATIVLVAIIFITSEAMIISKTVVAIFGALSLLIIILAIFNHYWGSKTAFWAAIAIVLPANVMLGVITASWLAFLGSFVALLIIVIIYFSAWGLITRIIKGKKIEEGSNDDDE
jgi:hypothetical protein